MLQERVQKQLEELQRLGENDSMMIFCFCFGKLTPPMKAWMVGSSQKRASCFFGFANAGIYFSGNKELATKRYFSFSKCEYYAGFI